MCRPTLQRRSAFWVVCVCALLLPRLAVASQYLAIDFDGDGQRDQVRLDLRQPSVLQVWLSASDTTHVIRSRVPLLQMVTSDLDGDHRPELIARDSESRIRVWTHRHEGFRRYRARKVVPGTLKPKSRGVDDPHGEPLGAITTSTLVPFELTLCASPRAPAFRVSRPSAPRSSRPRRSFTAAEPFPRPPPTHVPV